MTLATPGAGPSENPQLMRQLYECLRDYFSGSIARLEAANFDVETDRYRFTIICYPHLRYIAISGYLHDNIHWVGCHIQIEDGSSSSINPGYDVLPPEEIPKIIAAVRARSASTPPAGEAPAPPDSSRVTFPSDLFSGAEAVSPPAPVAAPAPDDPSASLSPHEPSPWGSSDAVAQPESPGEPEAGIPLAEAEPLMSDWPLLEQDDEFVRLFHPLMEYFTYETAPIELDVDTTRYGRRHIRIFLPDSTGREWLPNAGIRYTEGIIGKDGNFECQVVGYFNARGDFTGPRIEPEILHAILAHVEHVNASRPSREEREAREAEQRRLAAQAARTSMLTGFVRGKMGRVLDAAQSEEPAVELPDIIESIYDEAETRGITEDLSRLVLDVFPVLIRERRNIAAVTRDAFSEDNPPRDFEELRSRIEASAVHYESFVYRRLWENPAVRQRLGMKSERYNRARLFANREHTRIFKQICGRRSLSHLAPHALLAIEEVADIPFVDPDRAQERRRMLERKLASLTSDQKRTLREKLLEALNLTGGAARRAAAATRRAGEATGRAVKEHPEIAGAAADVAVSGIVFGLGGAEAYIIKSVVENMIGVSVVEFVEAILKGDRSILSKRVEKTWDLDFLARMGRLLAGIIPWGSRGVDKWLDERRQKKSKPEVSSEGEAGKNEEPERRAEPVEQPEEPTIESLITQAADGALNEHAKKARVFPTGDLRRDFAG